jgi:hypothetical protein
MCALQTVQKIGPVLDLFTVERPEWGVSEVAAVIDIPRSNAHALLSAWWTPDSCRWRRVPESRGLRSQPFAPAVGASGQGVFVTSRRVPATPVQRFVFAKAELPMGTTLFRK